MKELLESLSPDPMKLFSNLFPNQFRLHRITSSSSKCLESFFINFEKKNVRELDEKTIQAFHTENMDRKLMY
jgi:hypothetical protein